MRKSFRRFTIPAVAAAAAVAASIIAPIAMGGSDDSVGASAPVTVPSTTAPTTTSPAPDTTMATATTEKVPPPTTAEVTPPPPEAQPPEIQPTRLDVTLTPGEASSMDIEFVNGMPRCKPPYEGVELPWEQTQDFAGNEVYTHMGEDAEPTVYVEYAGAFNPIVAFIADGTVVFDVAETKSGTEITGVMRLQAGYMPSRVVACTDADW